MTAWVSPAMMVAAGMLPVAVGAETIAVTVTVKCFRSLPPDFFPFTVMVVEPIAIGSIVITVPDLEV